MAYLFLALWMPNQPHAVPYGEVRLHVLDVGQGSAVLIETAAHRALFDAGPAYPGGYSAGAHVIWPYMQGLAINQLDAVIISHPDLDHIGGLSALAEHIRIDAGYTSARHSLGGLPEQLCRSGQSWVWDDVVFSFVWPSGVRHLSKNNNSCVLQVRTRNNRALLTGDIEGRGERLMQHAMVPSMLQADWLLAPHHGSNGSSTPDFIRAVNPSYVVFSTGKYNAYHFPHPKTMARYACAKERQCMNTAELGSMVFDSIGDKWQYYTWRKRYPVLWHYLFPLHDI